MKRTGNLYFSIAEPENLRTAFQRAAKAKQDRPEVIRFRRNLTQNLEHLRLQLLQYSPDIGHYHFFKVHDPKPRDICAASFKERVLHHAVMQVCEPFLERYAVFDSYACRKGKGNLKAISRAQEFIQKNKWYLQLDIHKYFDSIDHAVLIQLLARRFKDRHLMDLFEKLLASYHTRPGKGLPIGNLVSQHLANFYLSAMDHHLKETRGIGCYLRYMDDFILFGQEKKRLQNELALIRQWLEENLKLELNEKIKLNRTLHGITFLGFCILPGTIRLSSKSRSRFIRKFFEYEQRYETGCWSMEQLIRHMMPLVNFTNMAKARNLRKQIIGFHPEERTE